MAQRKATCVDPIGYKLYIGVESNKEILPEMTEAVLRLSEAFYPYAEIVSKSNGTDASKDFFDRVDTLFSGQASSEDFRTYWTGLQERLRSNPEAGFSYVPTKIKVPRSSQKKPKVDMLPVCKQTIECVAMGMKDDPLLQEALESLVSCPSDDLRGVYAPRKNMRISFALLLLHNCIERREPQNGKKYLHRLVIQIPRYVADAVETGFTLQEQWVDAAKAICSCHEHAIASVCMDTMRLNGIPDFCTGDVCISRAEFQDDAHWNTNEMYELPGYAWGMCITRKHLERLGGWERLQREKGIFFTAEPLDNGGAYLQLTPNVNVIRRDENRLMAEFMAPALRNGKFNIPAYDVPSYRLHVPAGQLHWKGFWLEVLAGKQNADLVDD